MKRTRKENIKKAITIITSIIIVITGITSIFYIDEKFTCELIQYKGYATKLEKDKTTLIIPTCKVLTEKGWTNHREVNIPNPERPTAIKTKWKNH